MVSLEEESFILDIKHLKKIDPEFYKFLQENDKDLLQIETKIGNFSNESKLVKEDQHITNDQLLNELPDSMEVNDAMFIKRFEEILEAGRLSKSFRSLSLLIKMFNSRIKCSVKDFSFTPLTGSLKFLLNQKRLKKNTQPAILKESYTKEHSLNRTASPIQDCVTSTCSHSDIPVDLLKKYFSMLLGILEICNATLENYMKFFIESVEESLVSDLVFPKTQSCKTKVIRLLKQLWSTLHLVFEQGMDFIEILQPYYESSLVLLSSHKLLRWLAPIRYYIRQSVLETIIHIWIQGYRSKECFFHVSTKAFDVLCQYFSLLQKSEFYSFNEKSDELSQKSQSFLMQQSQQNFLGLCQKRYITLLQKTGLTTKNASRLAYLEACLVQLFSRSFDAVVYRLLFLTVRQLANCARNSMRAQSRGVSGKKRKKCREPERLKSKRIQDTSKLLYHWSFIFCCRLVVAGISAKPVECFPLAYPLSSVLTCVIKMSLNNPIYLPFVLQCCTILCSLMETCDIFLSLGGFLTAMGDMIVLRLRRLSQPRNETALQLKKSLKKRKSYRNPSHIGRSDILISRKKSVNLTPPTTRAAMATPSDLDSILTFKATDLALTQSLIQFSERWTLLCVNYYGLLALHPAFPESCMTFLHHCNQYLMCKVWENIKHLLSLCRETSKVIYRLRFNLDPLLMPTGLHVLPKEDIPLVQYRATLTANQLIINSLQKTFQNVPKEPILLNHPPVIPSHKVPASSLLLPAVYDKQLNSCASSLLPFNLDSDADSHTETSLIVDSSM